MHMRWARPFLTLVAAAGLLGSAAPAAQAAPAAARPVSITLGASATSIDQGQVVRFTGRIWQAQTGNRAPMYFYFQRRGTTTWMSGGYAWSNDRGDYAKSFRATYSGTWKVVYRGTATRAAAVRGRVVDVYATTPRQVVAYTAASADWQGPKLRIPTAEFTAVATYTCQDAGFLFLTWYGDQGGYDSADLLATSGTVTLNGHHGAQVGYFEVSSWLGCSWTVKVYSGTAKVLV